MGFPRRQTRWLHWARTLLWRKRRKEFLKFLLLTRVYFCVFHSKGGKLLVLENYYWNNLLLRGVVVGLPRPQEFSPRCEVWRNIERCLPPRPHPLPALKIRQDYSGFDIKIKIKNLLSIPSSATGQTNVHNKYCRIFLNGCLDIFENNEVQITMSIRASDYFWSLC